VTPPAGAGFINSKAVENAKLKDFGQDSTLIFADYFMPKNIRLTSG
jgi:hypothetical protein